MAGHKSVPRSNFSLHPRGKSFPLNYPHQNPSIDDCFALHNKPFTYFQILNYLSLESSSFRMNLNILISLLLLPRSCAPHTLLKGWWSSSELSTVYTSSLNCGAQNSTRSWGTYHNLDKRLNSKLQKLDCTKQKGKMLQFLSITEKTESRIPT